MLKEKTILIPVCDHCGKEICKIGEDGTNSINGTKCLLCGKDTCWSCTMNAEKQFDTCVTTFVCKEHFKKKPSKELMNCWILILRKEGHPFV